MKKKNYYTFDKIMAFNIGNSFMQICLYHQKRFSFVKRISLKEKNFVDSINLTIHRSLLLISSVNPSAEEVLVRYLRKERLNYLRVRKDFHIPLKTEIKDIKTAGDDRLLNSFAAYRRAKRGCIICDLGSAVTIDFVDPRGVFVGGTIIPGIKLQISSLFQKCALIPQTTISRLRTFYPIGKNTQEAIQRGVFNSVVGLYKQSIDFYKQKYKIKPVVFLTGGDAYLLKHMIKYDYLIPQLTLEGLVYSFLEVKRCLL